MNIHVPDNLKPIPGLDGYYASAEARIFSTRGRQLRELSQFPIKKYLAVKIFDRHHYVHRLVCAAFHGPCPAGHETCHRNGRHHDNVSTNVYWGTHKQNTADSVRLGTQYRFKPHDQVHTRKLTEAQVIEIRARLAAGGQSQRQLAREYGVHPAAITYLKQGKTYASVATPAREAA